MKITVTNQDIEQGCPFASNCCPIAKAAGFELIDGAVYCEPCAEREKHSDCEDHPCEDCLGTAIDRAMDFADMER